MINLDSDNRLNWKFPNGNDYITTVDYEGYSGRGQNGSPCEECTSCGNPCSESSRIWLFFLEWSKCDYQSLEFLCDSCTELLTTNLSDRITTSHMEGYWQGRDNGLFN